MNTVFAHRPWSDAEAAEHRACAEARLSARARRNGRINHLLMGVAAFCGALFVLWRDAPIALWLAAGGAVAVGAALYFARAGLDPDLELRRWEFDHGYRVVPSARLEGLLADSTLPAEIPAAIHRWQALGYSLRRRDVDFLLGVAGRTDHADESDEYFNYVLLREDA